MLHGRAVEQTTVDRLLAGARAGAGAALVVRGEIGIGKTALLGHAAARAAEHGMRVLRCTGVESEVELPFAALHLLLRPFLSLAERLPAPQAAALRGAFGLSEEREGDRFLVGMAALTLLADVAADRPLLCLVDDAEWVDRSSAEALLFAARRLDAERVVMLFAAGDDFAAGAVPELRLRELDRRAALALLTARAAERGDAEGDDTEGRDAERGDVEGVAVRAPAPPVLERLLDEAAGNPLALLELAAALTPGQRAGGLTALPLATGAAAPTS
ncbi:ATP-binding protein, partial [Nonomuraea sp. NPDC050691]|uniref:ATP-binding protein n=1 Tax=Nonomuraea sp. NPDC050691 TaxID=3155661 RepID=UPI0033EE7320